MEVVILAAAVFAVVYFIRRRPPTPPADLPVPNDVPTFKVVALGVSGAGKTVLLASMFHALNVQRRGSSYFLEAALEQRVELAAVFREITNPQSPWPSGTNRGDLRTYMFNCVADQDGDRQEVLRIEYIDYAGEHLELIRDGDSTKLRELQAHIDGASALLGIIDGHRLLQYLRGEAEGFEYFHATIEPVLGLMIPSGRPLHFVLTKWDLVRDFGEPADATDEVRLQKVVERLALTKIDALVKGPRRGGSIVRIIPVSAVGPDYATLDETGRVVKRSTGTVRPFNVEIPFAAVVPDLFRQAAATLDDADRQAVEAQLKAQADLRPRERLARLATLLAIPAGIALKGALLSVLPSGAADAMADTFVDWLRRPGDARRAKDKADRESEKLDADLVRNARTLVLKDFEDTVKRLEWLVPSSVLSNR